MGYVKLDSDLVQCRVDLEFIKSYIINTETCEVLSKYMSKHNDNLDTKYKLLGLTNAYNILGHIGVLQSFLNTELGHVNIKNYCLEYGKFTRDRIIDYVKAMSDNDIRIMINIFVNTNNLRHDSVHLNRYDIIEMLFTDDIYHNS